MRRSSTSAGVRWSTVETVLRRELAGHERLLRRIMIALRKVGIPPEEDDAKSA
jgi:lambda repressor-like predicted transcriptional regulator